MGLKEQTNFVKRKRNLKGKMIRKQYETKQIQATMKEIRDWEVVPQALSNTISGVGIDNLLVSTPTTTTDGQVQSPDTTTETTPTMKETSKQLMLTPYQNTICSVRDFLARASASLAKEGDLPIYGEHYSMRYAESLGLKELRIFGLKMLKDYCLLHIQKLSKSGVRKILMPMENLPPLPLESTRLSLELKDGFFSRYSTRFGNLGMTVNGKCLTARIGESLKTGSECSLSDILEESVDQKYFLSEKMVNYLMTKRNDYKLLQVCEVQTTKEHIT